MINLDTVSLLQECDAGTKMAVSSINDILDKINSPDLKRILTESREHHEKLGNEIHQKLSASHMEAKEPSTMAKGMSWLKATVKMNLDESDATAADLLTDGCNMGVKSLHKYLNQYKAADDMSKSLCRRLVSIEEELCQELRTYL